MYSQLSSCRFSEGPGHGVRSLGFAGVLTRKGSIERLDDLAEESSCLSLEHEQAADRAHEEVKGPFDVVVSDVCLVNIRNALIQVPCCPKHFLLNSPIQRLHITFHKLDFFLAITQSQVVCFQSYHRRVMPLLARTCRSLAYYLRQNDCCSLCHAVKFSWHAICL